MTNPGPTPCKNGCAKGHAKVTGINQDCATHEWNTRAALQQPEPVRIGYISPVTLASLNNDANGSGHIVAAAAYDTLIPVYLAPPASADMREALEDARRYQRLRVLGCAPAYTKHLEDGSVLRFTNLDEFVDADLKSVPSRGESLANAQGKESEGGVERLCPCHPTDPHCQFPNCSCPSKTWQQAVRDAWEENRRPSDPTPPDREAALPPDVVRLVVAARRAFDRHNHPEDQTMRDLDRALEAFSSDVRYEDEPDALTSGGR